MRSSGLSLLVYKDKLIATIKATIHLKCKEAATLGATVGMTSVLEQQLEKLQRMRWFSLFPLEVSD